MGTTPAADLDDVWVVMPVFNEAPVLAQTLAGVTAQFGHVVCVDDCSSDTSAQIAQSFFDAGVRTVRHPFNMGQGAALQTGIEYALLDPLMRRVVTFDADGQHRVADAVALVRHLGPQAEPAVDVALGSRFLASRGEMGWLKRLVLRAAIAYTNSSVGLRLTDTHNGLRAFSRQVAAGLDLRHNGMAHATEILEQIARSGARWTEVPVRVEYSPYSRSKGQSLLNSVNILVELLLK
jgi:glycosyltransferase involved in cell wall biosynthesis